MSGTRPIITLTTDFGAESPYVAQMKGALLSVNRAAVVVDISHSIPPQDVAAGALVLAQACGSFPADSIHVAVVDPGVGSGRDILCARSDRGTWIAPDNGLLTRVLQPARSVEIRRVTNSDYWRHPVSHTFHGRDIMAPAAAHLSLGVEPRQLGEIAERCVQLPLADPCPNDEGILGTVLWLDTFGNAVTNIRRGHLPAAWADSFQVAFRGSELPLVQVYAEAEPGTLVALWGSHESLELAVVNGSAACVCAVRAGDEVLVRRPAASQE